MASRGGRWRRVGYLLLAPVVFPLLIVNVLVAAPALVLFSIVSFIAGWDERVVLEFHLALANFVMLPDDLLRRWLLRDGRKRDDE